MRITIRFYKKNLYFTEIVTKSKAQLEMTVTFQVTVKYRRRLLRLFATFVTFGTFKTFGTSGTFGTCETLGTFGIFGTY